MDLYPTTETWTRTPGAIAPADGNAASAVAPACGNGTNRFDTSIVGAQHAAPLLGTTDLGPNNERLEDLKPKLVHALRELVRQYREEGVVARRHEIRRIRQARLFWQGLQYAWWNPNDMNWHLPFEQRFSDDRALEEMPRYQFVTNFYQGFGLSFIAVLSQDVPSELTDQQLASINALNQQLLGNQQQLGNSLAPQFQSIANNPGLSAADKAAVTSQSQGALGSAFDALQGLSGLFGVDTNLLGRTLGIPSELLNARANASRPSGFFSSLGSSLGGTLGGIPGLFL